MGWLIDLAACQFIWGYFMPTDKFGGTVKFIFVFPIIFLDFDSELSTVVCG